VSMFRLSVCWTTVREVMSSRFMEEMWVLAVGGMRVDVAATSNSFALPNAYAGWQERLSQEFFSGRRGQPVVMFVDRDVLQELAEPGQDGPRSLVGAVRQLVDVSRGPSMFQRVLAAQDVWRRGTRDQPPPTLPVLALSVLAASQMRRDDQGARHSYYIRLARAMLPDGSEVELEALRHTLRERGAFVPVVEMWDELDRWLTESVGEFGLSTICGDPDRTRIGYPLSQALVRQSDRAALTRFFAKLNLTAEGVPGPESLIALLRVWTSHRPQGLSDRFVESLDDPSVRDYVKTLVHELAEAWDGKIVTADGLRRLDLRLVLDLDRGSAWWAVPSVAGIAEDLLEGTSDGHPFSVVLTTDPHSSMYEADGLPAVSAAALAGGLVARGTISVAEFQPSKLIVLVDNADAGGMLSVDALQPYDDHAFVVAPEAVDAVERALQTAADVGWHRVAPAIADRILPGYAIYYGITFADREALESALAVLPLHVAANFRVGSTARPRLVNGLPLLRNVNRNVYLSGGEPDLALPVGAEPRRVAVTFDGDTDELPASIFPFPLRRFGPYDEGSHTIEADGEELPFILTSGSADDRTPPGIGSLSWADGTLQDATAEESVCGAIVKAAIAEHPILAKRGAAESWLLAASGRATRLDEPPPPVCFGALSFSLFEVDRSRAAWLVQKRRSGWVVSRMRTEEPAFENLSAEERMLWVELAASVVSDDPVWKLYRDAWEQRRGR